MSVKEVGRVPPKFASFSPFLADFVKSNTMLFCVGCLVLGYGYRLIQWHGTGFLGGLGAFLLITGLQTALAATGSNIELLGVTDTSVTDTGVTDTEPDLIEPQRVRYPKVGALAVETTDAENSEELLLRLARLEIQEKEIQSKIAALELKRARADR